MHPCVCLMSVPESERTTNTSNLPLVWTTPSYRYNDYFGGYLTLCILQTLVAPIRLLTSRRYYSTAEDRAAQVAGSKKKEIKEGDGKEDEKGDGEKGDVVATEDGEVFEGFGEDDEDEDEDGKDKDKGGDADDEGMASTADVVAMLSAALPAGLTYGWVQIISTILVDIPELPLLAVYFQSLGRSPLSEGFNSMAAFTLVFCMFNVGASLLLLLRYVRVWIGTLTEASLGKPMMDRYKKRSWQMLLAVLFMLVIATVTTNWIYVAYLYLDPAFGIAWSSYADTFLDFQKMKLTAVVLCSISTVYAFLQSRRLLINFAQILPGKGYSEKWTLMVDEGERKAFRKKKIQNVLRYSDFAGFEEPGEEDDDDGIGNGYREDRVIEKTMAIIGVVGLAIHGPMMLLQATYFQTMSATAVDVSTNVGYSLCLTADGTAGFPACASQVLRDLEYTSSDWSALAPEAQLQYVGGFTEWQSSAVATLGPTSIDKVAIMFTALSLIAGQ